MNGALTSCEKSVKVLFEADTNCPLVNSKS